MTNICAKALQKKRKNILQVPFLSQHTSSFGFPRNRNIVVCLLYRGTLLRRIYGEVKKNPKFHWQSKCIRWKRNVIYQLFYRIRWGAVNSVIWPHSTFWKHLGNESDTSGQKQLSFFWVYQVGDEMKWQIMMHVPVLSSKFQLFLPSFYFPHPAALTSWQARRCNQTCHMKRRCWIFVIEIM
jgi:hypothetical protein